MRPFLFMEPGNAILAPSGLKLHNYCYQLFLLLFLMVSLAPAQAMLERESQEPDTVEYRAVDLFYDVQTRTFNLHNKAQLKYKGSTLNADTIWFDQERSILQAHGSPIIRDPTNPPIAGLRMKYNIDTRIGQIYYGTSHRDGQQFNGVDIRRLPDSRLLIARGDFSTCDNPDHQHYYFYSRRMVVKPKESVVAQPVVLNIADVPIAVLPLMVAPLKGERRSGLLTPRFGGDQSQGFFLRDLGYYWATNEYIDLTTKGEIVEGSNADFDNTTLETQFRYNKRYVLDGQIRGRYYLKHFDPNNALWMLEFRHNQNITPDGKQRLSGDGSFVNSRTIPTRGLDQQAVLNQQANAQMAYSLSLKNNKSLTLRTRQDYNLVTGQLSREFPDIQFRAGGPLFAQTDFDEDSPAAEEEWFRKINYNYSTRGNIFYRKQTDTLLRQDTARTWIGYRDELSFTYAGNFLNVINVTPSARFSGNWSAQSFSVQGDSVLRNQPFYDWEPSGGRFGNYFLGHSYSIGTDTRLFGIWVPEIGRFTGVRHIITPSLSYTFAPKIDTNKTFVAHPLLGQSTSQTKQQTLGMGISNDFDIKYMRTRTAPADSSDEKALEETYGNLRLLTTRSNTSYNFAADSFHFAPIASSVGLQVLPNYFFTVNMTHDFYHRFTEDPSRVRTPQLTRYSYELSRTFRYGGDFNAGLPSTLKGYEMTPWSAEFYYRFGFVSQRVSQSLFQETISHSSSMRLSLQPTPNWRMSYSNTYDYDKGQFSSHQFGFERKIHCWTMDFNWTPVGPAAGWNFHIRITDLPDVGIRAADTRLR